MSSDLTPMMRQYHSVKDQHLDAILFYRLGDFYEMFHDDALKASKLLGLTLTSRNKNQEDKIPMCGIPFHSAPGYIQKLLAHGCKVAICEQLEVPSEAKGIVKREVVQILTPALVLDPECLESRESRFLVSLYCDGGIWGLAKCDITTGQFVLTQYPNSEEVLDEILKIEPKEILLCPQKDSTLSEKLKTLLPSSRIDQRLPWCFESDYANEMYERMYQVSALGLGLQEVPVAAMAGGAVLGYLFENKILKPSLLSRPCINSKNDFLMIDDIAKRNLELLRTQPDGGIRGSLFWLLDKTMTPMGARLMREWILYPLINLTLITHRQEAVSLFFNQAQGLKNVRELLSKVSDLERLINRVVALQANARDLCAIASSLKVIPELLNSLSGFDSTAFRFIKAKLNALPEVSSQIESTLVDEPPLSIKDGGMIREGFHAELDELRHIERNSLSLISQMENVERERTGISSLKIRYNRVFGYYLEITHAHKDKIPADYIRKQTLTNAERFVTPQLKEYEDKILGATEKMKRIETDLFSALRDCVAGHSSTLKSLADGLAQLDTLQALAQVATENNYVCPTLTTEPVLDIVKGRHPLVEAIHTKESFIPNDVCLNRPEPFLMMITGPNMAGKSTVMRQVALITILAQMGSFVPAEKAHIGLADRIFTRIGASDHLQKGQSTFMVEMIETAQILAKATKMSLIILDEIGRGTSTFDGLSIAWAVAETIHDQIQARTFFATHYHELTDLAESRKGIANYHMAVREMGSEIRFIRELKKGGTNRSLGVHVARMAGLPVHTVNRAKELMCLLEKKDLSFKNEAQNENQPSLFETPAHLRELLEECRNIDINKMTPISALNFLADFKSKL